jgi:hypothetical protein
MITSVHIANVGPGAALSLLRKVPKPVETSGLRHADLTFTAPLSASILGRPDLGRVALLAFWDDDAALDRFLADHPVAQRLAGGWHVRLEPLRAFGSWPGLPAETPTSRAVDYDGPLAALTLGRLRFSQAPRFLRASAKAEARALRAPGLVWATGLARPPLVSTCSLWESTRALSTYAYGNAEPAHPDAIAEGERKPFHHQQAFIRFRPYGSVGGLTGRNPLTEQWMAPS